MVRIASNIGGTLRIKQTMTIKGFQCAKHREHSTDPKGLEEGFSTPILRTCWLGWHAVVKNEAAPATLRN